MDVLANIGVNPDLPKNLLISALLRLCPEDDLRDLRIQLFESVKASGLAHPNDNIVKRLKRAVGLSLAEKYAADIADLCYALRHKQPVPRTLLKNGKRSAAAFISSRLRDSPSGQTSQANDPSPQSTDETTLHGNPLCDGIVSDCSGNNRAITTLTRELGFLRRDVTQLKSDILGLKSTSVNEMCCIYVRLKALKPDELCESLLSAILQCPIACYSIIRCGSI